jgi:hypothetical protein
MHSLKVRNPATESAIQAYLSSGGTIQRFPPTVHGTCERRKGIQFGGKDPQLVRQETEEAAAEEARRREWVNGHGGMKLVREQGITPPWELQQPSYNESRRIEAEPDYGIEGTV